MFAKSSKQGTVKFSLNVGKGAKKVELAGSFGSWKPQAMKKGADGAYSISLAVPKGTHEYKFVVDGQWQVDPDNNAWAMNPYGTLNSVAKID